MGPLGLWDHWIEKNYKCTSFGIFAPIWHTFSLVDKSKQKMYENCQKIELSINCEAKWPENVRNGCVSNQICVQIAFKVSKFLNVLLNQSKDVDIADDAA